ncbi:MAG: FadR/GntR family transcriptional regulator [Smithellaceae bacterium]|nr:FadR/GntR family transcriptional regulator [Smithellaceae bacterium]
MTFEKISQAKFKKKSSFIADQILTMINSGHYPAGSKLPSERVITEQMGVSRPSLREAISALQNVGILESRPGDGTYVCHSVAPERLFSQALSVLEECDSPFENMQARKVVEAGAVRLAIEVASDEDILALKAIWDRKCELGRRGDLEEYLLYGKEFHLAIARTTKNRIIEGIMEKLLDLTMQPLWISLRRDYYRNDPVRFSLMLDVHDRIVKAICRRDADSAVRELEYHFDVQIEQIYSRVDDNGYGRKPQQNNMAINGKGG